MKRPLLITALTSATVLVSAQSINIQRERQEHKQAIGVQRIERPNALPAVGEQRSVFWSEDFSGGSIPAGWTNEDVMTPTGQTPVTFEWSNNPAAVTVAALGHQHMLTFNGPTASNGYLWANSDRGLPSAPASNHMTELTTTAIDCSGQPSVMLSFQSVIGVFDNNASDHVKVRVSTDLTNWTDFYPFPCLETGSPAPPCQRFSANPQAVSLNISSVAANQSTVYLRFQWQGGWEYYWAIDDIALSAVPDHERAIGGALLSHMDPELQYGRVPRNQLFPEFILGAYVDNIGANAQTNLSINASVSGPGGGTAFAASQTFASVPAAGADTMYQVVNLPAGLDQGVYTVTYSITSDQDAEEGNPADDTFERRFALDDALFSLDGIGVHPPAIESTTSLGTNSFTDAEDGLTLFTYYNLASAATVYGMEALLAPGTVAGAQVVFIIYPAENVDDMLGAPVAESEFIEITAEMIAAGRVTGQFMDGSVNLSAGEYYAGVVLYSNSGGEHVRIVDDISVAQANGASLIHIIGGSQPGLYGNGNAIAVRLHMTNIVGMDEVALSNVSMYPNPTTGALWITTGDQGNSYVEVRNTLGSLVHSTNFNANTAIDLSGFAKGVYMVRVGNEKGSYTQRVVLQ
jgi:hypothetical protein